jgi:hypothetical protein
LRLIDGIKFRVPNGTKLSLFSMTKSALIKASFVIIRHAKYHTIISRISPPDTS